MKLHPVKVHPSKALLKREDQLAWKMAGVAVDKVAVEKPVQEMIINRIIDNASVAIAAINRRPVVSARGMALGHAKKAGGAQVFGVKAATTVPPITPTLATISRRSWRWRRPWANPGAI